MGLALSIGLESVRTRQSYIPSGRFFSIHLPVFEIRAYSHNRWITETLTHLPSPALHGLTLLTPRPYLPPLPTTSPRDWVGGGAVGGEVVAGRGGGQGGGGLG
jgi:hypothetical protein